MRIFFGVGGPNATSSFHVIGEIFDHVFEWGGLTSPPLKGIQTVSVPPGGAVMADLTLDVPGKYIVVDHALSRLEAAGTRFGGLSDRRGERPSRDLPRGQMIPVLEFEAAIWLDV